MPVSRETAKRLSELIDLFHYLKPENRKEEREKFFDALEEGLVYNPSYAYRGFPHIEDSKELLDELRASAEKGLEKSMVASLQGRLRMILSIGSEDITSTSREYYGRPDTDLVLEAREAFSVPEDAGDATVEASKLKEAFDALFDELGVSYGCDLADEDIIRNSPRQKSILVPRAKSYTPTGAERLLVHETTHSVRTVNGLAQDELPLVYGTEGYELTEEGLATFNEAEIGVFSETRPRVTARVIAVAAADTGFHALYREMLDLGLDPRTAFIRAYRVKRGLADTSVPGGFIKDHIYFQGYSMLSENPELADSLYVGKIGIGDIDTVTGAPEISRDAHLEACETVSREVLQTR